MTPSSPDGQCKLGVLAFGDSITNGGGELQWGVALQSWALWVARGLGLPYSGYAVDGARVSDVVGMQIPAFHARCAQPDARYQLGCLYIGVNDVRSLDWNAAAFERTFATAMSFLRERCDRVLTATAPLHLGRPRTGSAKVGELNDVVGRVALDLGALVVDLRSFGARSLVMADHVHPTAFGQVVIAERALRVLADDGMRVAAWPSTMISYETTSWRRLRGDLTYVYRSLKGSARAAWVRLRAASARCHPHDQPG